MNNNSNSSGSGGSSNPQNNPSAPPPAHQHQPQHRSVSVSAAAIPLPPPPRVIPSQQQQQQRPTMAQNNSNPNSSAAAPRQPYHQPLGRPLSASAAIPLPPPPPPRVVIPGQQQARMAQPQNQNPNPNHQNQQHQIYRMQQYMVLRAQPFIPTNNGGNGNGNGGQNPNGANANANASNANASSAPSSSSSNPVNSSAGGTNENSNQQAQSQAAQAVIVKSEIKEVEILCPPVFTTTRSSSSIDHSYSANRLRNNPNVPNASSNSNSSSSSSNSSSNSVRQFNRRVEFVVRIDRFSTMLHYSVQVPHFQMLSLIIEPRDVVRHLRNHLVIDLQSGYNIGSVDVLYQVSLVKAQHELHHTQEMSKSFVNGFPVSGSLYHLRRAVLSEFLVNDALTLFVSIESRHPCNSESQRQQRVYQGQIERQLVADMNDFIAKDQLADAWLVFPDGSRLGVHKAILSARSPVFAAMFSEEGNHLEARQNEVHIIDSTVDVFQRLLGYIYSGSLEGLEEYALDLLTASDKYQLPLLKEITERCILSRLTPESVVSVLGYADLHSSPALRARCIAFITEHSTEVITTDQWKVMVDSQPNLLAELYADMAHKASPYLGGSLTSGNSGDSTTTTDASEDSSRGVKRKI